MRAKSYIVFNKEDTEQSIPLRFEQQVGDNGSALAVRTPYAAMTYDELNQAANRVAHALLTANGETAEPVALLLEHGVPTVVGMLGVLKAGKFYVALDRSSAEAWCRDVLGDSGARLILTDQCNHAVARALSPPNTTVLDIDAIDHAFPSEDPKRPIESGALAYIFYTSGSTGKPKGVMDSHRNVLHNIMRYTNTLKISADDRLSLVQSFSFSGSVSSLFGALLNGAAVFPFDVRAEGLHKLTDWISQQEITIYHSVPTTFRHLADGVTRFPKLRLIRLEGDQAMAQDVELFKREFSMECRLVNGLGATECGLVRQYFVDHDTNIKGNSIPVGYPVEDMHISIINEAGDDVGSGTIGELVVKSRYLALGYWNRDELTSRAFTRSECAPPGMRTYHTGDLGRLNAKGCLEHLGRKHFQMKIRGQQVDINTVEQTIAKIGSVKETVVQTYRDGTGEARLAAYVVSTGQCSTVSELHRHVSAKLPAHMVPSAFVVLDRLPLTDDGKLDRQALPAPGSTRPNLEKAFTAPGTLLESQLAGIWSHSLKLQSVGVHDDFLELGGDSLIASRIVIRIRESLDLELDIAEFLEHPTIHLLARYLSD